MSRERDKALRLFRLLPKIHRDKVNKLAMKYMEQRPPQERPLPMELLKIVARGKVMALEGKPEEMTEEQIEREQIKLLMRELDKKREEVRI